MGTEKSAVKSSSRCKPPPVPPRPQHLIPVKTMSKFSSMPDILNSWKRDTNPDLLKLNNAGVLSKRSVVDMVRATGVELNVGAGYPLKHTGSTEYITENKLMSNYGDIKTNGNNYTMLPVRGRGRIIEAEKNGRNNSVNGTLDVGNRNNANGKTSKKFGCIPSRSDSKKKQKNMLQINNNDVKGNCRYGKNTNNNCSNSNENHGQISQTSWYVEDMLGNTTLQLSKCEISVNDTASNANSTKAPNHMHKNAPSENISRVAVDYCVLTNDASNSGTNDSINDVSQHSRTYRKNYQQLEPQSPLPKPQQTMMSSSSFSALPLLPKSLSDASLLWETTNKKIPVYPVSLSPARSSSSSSSRGSSIVHPKVPPPAVPRSNSTSSDEQSKFSAVYVNSLNGVGRGGDQVGKEERPPPPPPPRKPTSLDMKLSILRKEMHVLRQMDLSLLAQLWSLNESIHEFRQKQELLSPNSPFINSSDEEDSGCYHSNISSQGIVTSNHHNTLGSSSSRSSISTGRFTLRDSMKP